jgi:pyrimidine deaminase RibD-like protein
MTSEIELTFLRAALDEARKCIPTPTAFCVGCVITAALPGQSPVILATGFSRELEGNTHAEANALTKLSQMSSDEISSLMSAPSPLSIDQLALDVYTTMVSCHTTRFSSVV